MKNNNNNNSEKNKSCRIVFRLLPKLYCGKEVFLYCNIEIVLQD